MYDWLFLYRMCDHFNYKAVLKLLYDIQNQSFLLTVVSLKGRAWGLMFGKMFETIFRSTLKLYFTSLYELLIVSPVLALAINGVYVVFVSPYQK